MTKKQQLHLSARIHKHGGNNGRLLAFLAHTEYIDSSIPAIQLTDRSITSDPLIINQEFASYYGKLYDDPTPPLETTFTDFFLLTKLPHT